MKQTIEIIDYTNNKESQAKVAQAVKDCFAEIVNGREDDCGARILVEGTEVGVMRRYLSGNFSINNF